MLNQILNCLNLHFVPGQYACFGTERNALEGVFLLTGTQSSMVMGCWWQNHYVGDFFNVKNWSPTSRCFQQHKPPVTNIDVAIMH